MNTFTYLSINDFWPFKINKILIPLMLLQQENKGYCSGFIKLNNRNQSFNNNNKIVMKRSALKNGCGQGFKKQLNSTTVNV